MAIRFLHDPDTGLPHCLRHGVREHEVDEVVAKPLEDRNGRDDSRIALGRTKSGRYLRVIYVPEHAGDIFVITAYQLHGKPLQALKRRLRQRGSS